jgi:hypothetical protein
MAYEILLGVAGLCVAGVIALAAVEIPRWRKATPGYQPRHTAEQQPVVHVGVTETSPRLVDLPLAPPAPPIDPLILLREAEGALKRAQRRVDELRAQVAAQDANRVHIALDALERSFRQRLSRTGRHVHLEADTAEFRRSDIRRPARSGAPR